MENPKRAELDFPLFSSRNTFALNDWSPGSGKSALWICEKGHEWSTAIRKVVQQGHLCPYCQNKQCLAGFNDLEFRREDLLAYYDHLENPHPSTVQVTSAKPLWWQCPLGHRWQEKPFYLTKRIGEPCPSCRARANSIANLAPSFAGWLVNEQDESVAISSRTPLELKCPIGHRFKESPGLLKNNPKCPHCDGRRVLEGFNDLKTLCPELVFEWNDPIPIEQVSHQSKLKAQWKCRECHHEWGAFVYNRANGFGACPKCSKKSGSKAQKELTDFIESLGLEVEINTKSILPGKKELDIYIPELKTAIEYNGLYWHSTETNENKNRHYEKWLECQRMGIHLLVIWEDNWINNRKLIMRMLRAKLGENSESTTYARKTSVEELSSPEAKQFLRENHVQGEASGKSYGLKNSKDELVAVMTIRKSPSMKNYLEISRYATARHVPGGFTKLLAHIGRSKKPEGFVTFSDNSISDGSLYDKSGFVADRKIPADYSYVVDGKRCHKFGYRLSRFKSDPQLAYRSELSESELAKINGLRRVYDYGKIRWVLPLS